MDTHLNDKDIDRLVSGMMGRGEKLRARMHLEKCDSCREKVNILSGILSEKKTGPVPGDHVKTAVLAEWHRMNHAAAAGHAKPGHGLKLVYGLAAVLIIAVSAYFALVRIPHSIYDDGLSAASVTGDVHLNNNAAGISLVLHKGDLVSTGPGSSIILTAGNYTLELEGSSELRLAESGDETGFLFTLNRGAVTSRSEGKLKYAFACGGYRITPAGTEFRIEMSESSITVAVRSGSVVISGAELKIEVPAGMMWDSADTGNIRPAGTADTGDEKTDMKGQMSGTGGYSGGEPGGGEKVQDTESAIKNGDVIDPSEIRELKRESREDIREMKKESRKGRQYKGGN